jgi:hypothetical protein
MSLLVGTSMACESWSASRDFDVNDVCPGALEPGCVERGTGTVAPGGILDDVAVVSDDGRREGVNLRAAHGPPVGTRVVVEWWEISNRPRIVAIVDRASGRRYRTSDWPERVDSSGLGFALFGLLLAVPVGAAALLSRRRAARAAAVAGKPARLD